MRTDETLVKQGLVITAEYNYGHNSNNESSLAPTVKTVRARLYLFIKQLLQQAFMPRSAGATDVFCLDCLEIRGLCSLL
jgi:hypothetical protein